MSEMHINSSNSDLVQVSARSPSFLPKRLFFRFAIKALASSSEEARSFVWIARRFFYFLLSEWLVWIAFHLLPHVAFAARVLNLLDLTITATFCCSVLVHFILNLQSLYRHFAEAQKHGFPPSTGDAQGSPHYSAGQQLQKSEPG